MNLHSATISTSAVRFGAAISHHPLSGNWVSPQPVSPEPNVPWVRQIRQERANLQTLAGVPGLLFEEGAALGWIFSEPLMIRLGVLLSSPLFYVPDQKMTTCQSGPSKFPALETSLNFPFKMIESLEGQGPLM